MLKGQNINDVKNRNLSVILRTIKRLGQISRTELAKEVHLSNPAVGNLVTELLDLGLLKEVGSVSQGVGRSRVLLALNPNGVHVIGVEISRNGVFGVLTNMDGRLYADSQQSFAVGAPKGTVMASLNKVVDSLVQYAADKKYRLIGIGIGTPGPVDVASGRIYEPPNFPGLRNISLKDLMEERYQLPCLINDDARTSALGEAWFGAGQGVSSLVFVSLGEGIGSGIIFDGHLYNGAHDIAGQIGHFTVDPNGERCDCGNIGCLETTASIPAIAKRTRKFRLGQSGITDTESVAELISAYHSGVPEAQALFDEILNFIATAVVSAINSYDPQMVILGGRLIRRHPELVDMVRRSVVSRCYYHVANNLRIVGNELGEKTSSIGATCLILEQLMTDPAITLG